ncbi:hypothetical protein ACFQZO_05055 [Bradyrhizobium sp. GCM10027634]|uniref:hypothetical protein n=1 Tax=unclassified Bradyrhizobium TaxID=2631580 RepID=UPI00188C6A2D|nr:MULTISPECIES: hypothetical protein [unclassified Bradyrhizobium]MDN5000250.1 hypothetical protein [Bradyrhizobium sp. WYCCWR 12677]QOZ42977.1 hypothetical protein XH89_05470 [Bradyrhizobium sp. CCBAU 53340]
MARSELERIAKGVLKAKFTLAKTIAQIAGLIDRINPTERARLTWSWRQVSAERGDLNQMEFSS